MDTTHDLHRSGLIRYAPLGIVASDYGGTVAQDIGGIVDGPACHQDLGRKRVTKSVRMAIGHAALGEHSLEGPVHGLDVALARSAPCPEKVLRACRKITFTIKNV